MYYKFQCNTGIQNNIQHPQWLHQCWRISKTSSMWGLIESVRHIICWRLRWILYLGTGYFDLMTN